MTKNATRDADVTIAMEFKDIGLFDDSKKYRMYETGIEKARAVIPRIKQLIAERVEQ